MNKKQINILSWAISIISCLSLFVIFFLSMITFHKEAIIESEIELQKNKFEKILLIEKSLKKKFNSLTIPTQEQQKEIDKLLTCRCNISSVSVIYNNQYVYSTLSLYSNTGPADFKKGFSLKVKNTLTDRPVIRYSFHVNETTVLKFYLKPFEFSYIKKLGSPKINLFDFDLYEDNEVSDGFVVNDHDEFEFDMSDLNLFIEIDHYSLIRNLLKHYSLKILLLFMLLSILSFYIAKYSTKILLICMIKRNVIKPYIQPIVNRDGVVIGGEVLSRWIDSKGNIVSPLLFIPDLMKYNLIPLLTHSLLVQFYNFIEDKDIQELRISFNLTEYCLFDDNVFNTCKKLSLRCELVLEFTETSLFSDSKINEKMMEYRYYGIKFAIDDYGTGCSSLHYLIDYKFDYLKIDKCFIDGICFDNKSQFVLEYVCTLAKKLNIKIIPEGVESQCQQAALAQYDVHYYQGFLFSKPVPLSVYFSSLQGKTLPA